jgi:hypothetical protein
MPLHKIKLCYSVDGATAFHNWLQDWHDSVSTQTSDRITNEIPKETITKIGVDDEWYNVMFSYNSTEDITELQLLYDKIAEYCAWSVVGYHNCPDVKNVADPERCIIEESDIYRDGDLPGYIDPPNSTL